MASKRTYEQTPMNGPNSLWAAVIQQALMEAAGFIVDYGHGDKESRETVTRQARAWFSLSNPDFLTVCSLVDIEPTPLISLAKKAAEEPAIIYGVITKFKTRRENGFKQKEAA